MVEFWNRIIPPALTHQETDFLQQVLELHAGSRVLDVPCGNGRHAAKLAKRGCHVTGVDLSLEFLSLARQAAASAKVTVEYRHCDMRELPSTREFDAAYCWGNSFGYMDYAGAGAFLAALAGALKPGGRLALDSSVTAETILPALRPQRWHRTGDLVVLSEPHYAAAESRLDIDYTTIRRGVIDTRRASSYVFTAAEQLRMLAVAGIDVVALSGGMAGEEFSAAGPHANSKRFSSISRRLRIFRMVSLPSSGPASGRPRQLGSHHLFQFIEAAFQLDSLDATGATLQDVHHGDPLRRRDVATLEGLRHSLRRLVDVPAVLIRGRFMGIEAPRTGLIRSMHSRSAVRSPCSARERHLRVRCGANLSNSP